MHNFRATCSNASEMLKLRQNLFWPFFMTLTFNLDRLHGVTLANVNYLKIMMRRWQENNVFINSWNLFIFLLWLYNQNLSIHTMHLVIYFTTTKLAPWLLSVLSEYWPSHSARKPRLDPVASVRSSMDRLEPVEITWFDRLPQKWGPKAGAIKVGPS